MSITINGTTGISGVDGSSTTPAFQGTDTNTGLFYGTDIVGISTGGSERLRVDASGNVGIGTTSPNCNFQVNGVVRAATNNDKGVFSLGESAGAYAVNVGLWRGGANSAVSSTTGLVTTGGNFLNIGGYDGIAFTTGAANIGSQTEQMRIDSSGVLSFNSGYGSSAKAYGCRAWVKFNGTGTVAINGSANVTSITDNGTGDYTVNLTTAMPDTNYAVNVSCNGPVVQLINIKNGGTYSTSAIQVFAFGSNSSAFDQSIICVSVFR